MSEKLEFLYLTEEDIIEAGVLNMKECIDTIEEMFRLIGKGDYMMGGPNRNDHGLMLWFNEEEPFENMPKAGPDRRFMSLISYLGGDFDVVGNKWYGSNIENLKKGLPRSIHTFTLNDKETGAPLSIMAGNLVSSARTGAVPGVVSKHLAQNNAKVVGAVGGGAINQSCIEAITTSLGSLEKVVLFDINLEKGKEIAEKLEEKINMPVEVVDDIDRCVEQSDIVTVATSGKTKPKINERCIKPGSVIILTGSADFSKESYQNHRIVADLWSMHEKWLEDGLNHPDGISSITGWTMSGQLLDMVANEEYDCSKIDDIGDIIAGNKEGRKSDDEVIICMTGGLPTEDAAWGYRVYQNALKMGVGTKLPLWESSYLTK
ncbi:tyramine oxidase subunit B [Texcoconibacillus texcoconensis]|uniref:Ornithine cyclodeaminase n=1 Tax=Texcoconibacillus texcoconensis TaxID=1095777 RepID=A0A840QHT5_9BACI|nr:tyramine oxidase subunit B [Texcoconibacillus texcoconensis]MBB5171894.1 ornithine cyclodeaminase [Texcoconibacillus texcoconensis]